MSFETVEARLAKLENQVANLMDCEAIREVLYRYCRAVDRLDVELLKSCYWPEAYDTHWWHNATGHEFAEHVVGDVLTNAFASEHSLSNPMIDLDGTHAFVETRCLVLHRLRLNDGEFLDQQAHARYLDLFEKREGEWKLIYRHVVVDADRESRNPNLYKIRDSRAIGRHGTDDPVYAGFGIDQLRPEEFSTPDYWGPYLSRHASATTPEGQ